MWDGKSVDTIRILRFAIKQDKEQLANAPLGKIQRLKLEKQIKLQQEELKRLNAEKRKKL